MPSFRSWFTRHKSSMLALFVLLVAVAAGSLFLLGGARSGTSGERPPTDSDADSAATAVKETAAGEWIELPRETWQTAGIKITPAVRSDMASTVWVTGKVALNEDHMAHVYSQVAGRVESVHVRYGQRVKAGELLAVIQSREVGDAKLDLFRHRQELRIARLNQQRTKEIAANTQDLLDAIEAGADMEQIQRQFHERPMGDYREKLLGSYAATRKSEADFQRLDALAQRGITPGKDRIAAVAARDADRAAFQSLVEQARYTSKRELTVAEQTLQAAETEVAVAETALQIIGYDKEELAGIDPAREGETIAHYPLVAPLDGTVIAKDLVLLERVGTEQELLQIADLSTVWIQADIFEQHLNLLRQLDGRTITARAASYPGRHFEAKVVFTGEIVDERSRAVAMTMIADNADGLLKPGLFVEIELPGDSATGVLQVAATAVQEHAGQTFVFVHKDGSQFERRDVTVGRRSGDNVEITSGLKDGDPVVEAGGFALKSRLLADLLAED